jgi:hypothetical protein
MDNAAPRSPDRRNFSRYEKLVIGILASLQFTVILDFMTISPLGAIVMPKATAVRYWGKRDPYGGGGEFRRPWLPIICTCA